MRVGGGLGLRPHGFHCDIYPAEGGEDCG
jgi:hypothetical protein